MDVFIVNTHSVLNSGDAGIVLGEIQFLKKHFPNIRIAITSRTPEIDRAFYHPMGIEVFSPVLPAPSVFSFGGRKLRRSFMELFDVQAKRAMLSRMKRSDLVISNGGGYFWSNRRLLPGPMFFQNYLNVRLASALGKPILFFPQSFGPFDNVVGPRMLKTVLAKKNVIKILAREEVSFAFLNHLLKDRLKKDGTGICSDMAFFLSEEEASAVGAIDIGIPKPRIAVTLREWHFPETASNKREQKRKIYLSAYRQVCRKVFEDLGASLLIFAQARGPGTFEDDTPLSRSLFHDLREFIPDSHLLFAEFPCVVSPFYIIKLLSQVDLIVATRFHSAIFALLSGVPAISVGYQPKSRGVMELLDLEAYCIEIGEIDSKKIIEMIKRILKDRDALSRKITEKVARLQGEMETELKSCFKSFL